MFIRALVEGATTKIQNSDLYCENGAVIHSSIYPYPAFLPLARPCNGFRERLMKLMRVTICPKETQVPVCSSKLRLVEWV